MKVSECKKLLKWLGRSIEVNRAGHIMRDRWAPLFSQFLLGLLFCQIQSLLTSPIELVTVPSSFLTESASSSQFFLSRIFQEMNVVVEQYLINIYRKSQNVNVNFTEKSAELLNLFGNIETTEYLDQLKIEKCLLKKSIRFRGKYVTKIIIS